LDNQQVTKDVPTKCLKGKEGGSLAGEHQVGTSETIREITDKITKEKKR